jgi:hypothetical protein
MTTTHPKPAKMRSDGSRDLYSETQPAIGKKPKLAARHTRTRHLAGQPSRHGWF